MGHPNRGAVGCAGVPNWLGWGGTCPVSQPSGRDLHPRGFEPRRARPRSERRGDSGSDGLSPPSEEEDAFLCGRHLRTSTAHRPWLFIFPPLPPPTASGSGLFPQPGPPQQTLAVGDAAAPDHEPRGSAAPRGPTGFGVFWGQRNCPAGSAQKGCSRRYSRPLEPPHCPGQTSRASETAGCAGTPARGKPVAPGPVPGTLIRVEEGQRAGARGWRGRPRPRGADKPDFKK